MGRDFDYEAGFEAGRKHAKDGSDDGPAKVTPSFAMGFLDGYKSVTTKRTVLDNRPEDKTTIHQITNAISANILVLEGVEHSLVVAKALDYLHLAITALETVEYRKS